ncbi:MAG: MMPL family transporter [Deltaproteobacteria bacterium]|nr:MMPL family transporter [Deltaproteobacteria bacterium]
MEKVLEKLGSFVYRRHRALLLFICLLTAASFALILRLELKSDLTDVLPSDNPAVDEFTGFLNAFGSADNLIIALKSKDRRAIEHVDLIETLGKKLSASRHVDWVDYNVLFNERGNGLAARKFPLFLDDRGRTELKKRLTPKGVEAAVRGNKEEISSLLGSPVASELIQKDPLNIRSIVVSAFSRTKGQGNANTLGYYISKDNGLALIFVKPSGKGRDLKFVKEFSLWLDDTVKETLKDYRAGADIEVGMAGSFAFAMEANAKILREVVINALVSCVLVLLIFKFIFKKRLAVVALTATSLTIALAWTLGAAYLIYGSLNMVSSIVTAMLMGLGIDYIIHIYARLEAEASRCGLEDALKITFAKTAPGVVVGALTTAAAFFCITVTSFKGLHSLGIVAGIGVIACLLTALLFMTSAIAALEGFKKNLVLGEKKRVMKAGFAAAAVKNHPGAIIAAFALILIISIAGFTGIRFDNDPEAIGLKDSPAVKTDIEISKGFGQKRNPVLVTVFVEGVEGTDGEDALLLRMDKLSGYIKQSKADGVIADAATVAAFVPELQSQKQALAAIARIRAEINWAEIKSVFKRSLEENGFLYKREYDAYLDGLRSALSIKSPIGLKDLEAAGGKRAKYFYNGEKMKLAAYVFPKEGKWRLSDLNRVRDGVLALGDGFSFTGAPVMFETLKTAIIKESAIATVISSVLIFFILLMQFRTIARVLLTLVPLAAGFIITLGVMGLTGLNFNFINIGAVPLLLGIGVDYGVYVMQDHLENKGPSHEAALRVGGAVALCALTTIAGFGSLVTFAFKGISTLGVVISIGVTACLFSSLLLLPAALRYAEDRVKQP